MAVTFAGADTRPIGTMTCDHGCGAVFHDGRAETDGPLIHQRAALAGWFYPCPAPGVQIDVCPGCQPYDGY
ncbi:hypothetical protein ACIQOV_25370 [Kitasatospora sp. NPDC091257]|uniref:hypothetical protein n=1 Tax=unclassified Kitasatospora TaxID=2633591 RepID=UPI00364A91FA